MTTDKNDPWYIIGQYLGYPECCIESFMKLAHMGRTELQKQHQPHHGTGFVCCDACMSKTEEQLTHEINTNRSCPILFPSSEDDYGRVYEHIDAHVDQHYRDVGSLAGEPA